MIKWRVPTILFLIVVLLAVILGVKIMNNTPEKQTQEIISKYNESEYLNIINQPISSEEKMETQEKDFDDSVESIIGYGVKELIKDSFGKILLVALIYGFFMVVNCRIYNKLGIIGLPVNLYVILTLASFASIFLFNNILTIMLTVISLINNIILMIMQYKAIGINPYLLLLGLIPGIGVLILAIVSIYATCKLAEYFGKGTGFQLGLIFLPIVFLPILAFESE